MYTTLSHLDEAARQDASLSLRQRQRLCSSLKTLARAAGGTLESIPASEACWRERLAGFTPAKIDISVEHWRNVQSDCRAALRLVSSSSKTPHADLTDAWLELLDSTKLLEKEYEQKRLRLALTALSRFCSARGIEPNEVSDHTAALFLTFLEESRTNKKFRTVHRTACLCWNRAAEAIVSWPKQLLKVEDNRSTYVQPWDMFPKSLRDDIERYLAHLARPSLLIRRRFKPLKPGSIATRRRQIHEFISALVKQGHDPAQLQSLADVVEVETVIKGLEYYHNEKRPNGPAYKHASDITYVLQAIATHWVKVSIAHVDELKAISHSCAQHVRRGITKTNRTRLRQVREEDKLQSLLWLPHDLAARARASKSDALKRPRDRKARYATRVRPRTLTPLQRALLFQMAVAIELLIMTAMRRENIVELKLGETLLRRGEDGWHVAIPEDQVKNEVETELPLHESTANLINEYMKDHRPVLLKGRTSAWLFPGQGDDHKQADHFGKQISATIKRETGLDWHPHLFRHLLGYLTLDRQPGAYGLVGTRLGHKDPRTSTTYYTFMERTKALQHYDTEVLHRRAYPLVNTPVSEPAIDGGSR